jgi:hypothetical protein
VTGALLESAAGTIYLLQAWAGARSGSALERRGYATEAQQRGFWDCVTGAGEPGFRRICRGWEGPGKPGRLEEPHRECHVCPIVT